MLDLVLANFKCSVDREDEPLVAEDAYHPAIKASLIPVTSSDNMAFPSNPESRKYNFRKANFPYLYQLISEVDWSFLNFHSDVNLAVDTFYEKIYEIFDVAVPLFYSQKHNRSYPVWYTSQIKKLLRLKFIKHKKWLHTKRPADYEDFRDIRREVKAKVDLAYKEYISKTEASIKSDPK